MESRQKIESNKSAIVTRSKWNIGKKEKNELINGVQQVRHWEVEKMEKWKSR